VHQRPHVARHLAALLIVMITACTGGPEPADQMDDQVDAVVVASFDFTESALVAEIYAQALERARIPVRRELRLGPRELVNPALRQGHVDVVPEYLGSALRAVAPDVSVDQHDVEAVRAALADAIRPWSVNVLPPSRASNQNGFAVTMATAGRLRLDSLSDLARVREPLTLAAPAECRTRPFCLPGLREVYDARFVQLAPYASEAQRLQALKDEVCDIAVVFTTDGQLAGSDLVLLRDDRRLQPVENVTPIVSARASSRHGPRLTSALDAVSKALDTEGLRFLNWRIDVAGHDVASEASGWLLRHPAITGSPSAS
jgi:osmoprotectant transport system substrate-binding protein